MTNDGRIIVSNSLNISHIPSPRYWPSDFSHNAFHFACWNESAFDCCLLTFQLKAVSSSEITLLLKKLCCQIQNKVILSALLPIHPSHSVSFSCFPIISGSHVRSREANRGPSVAKGQPHRHQPELRLAPHSKTPATKWSILAVLYLLTFLPKL